MGKEDVGDSGQFLECVIPVRNRIVGAVAAGHDQWDAVDGPHQEMMERRIGQHHAEKRVAGRNRLGNLAGLSLAQQDDRSPHRREQVAL